jgi:hypothetical protein
MYGMPRPLAVRVLIGLLVFGAAVFAGPGAVGGPATANAQYDNCGLGPNPGVDRAITLRRHISCPEAKRVLRQLKGTKDTVPMACGRSRTVQGWRLKNPHKAFALVFTIYRRGKVSFYYERTDHWGRRAWCPPPPGSGEDLG